MEKASRWIVAGFGIVYVLSMAIAALLLPASDSSDAAVGLLAPVTWLRGGMCLLLASVCVLVVSGAFATLIGDYHRELATRAQPIEAKTVGALGTGVAFAHALAGVLYATRSVDSARLAYASAAVFAMFFAFVVAFAFLRASRALVIGYIAIGVGLAQALVVVVIASAEKAANAGQLGLIGSMATAAFAILIAMLGFVVAAGAE